MAKINKLHIYPVKPNPILSDTLIGTNSEDPNRLTNNFMIGSLVSLVLQTIGNNALTRLVSGVVIWLQDMDFEVSQLEYFIDSEFYTAAPVIVTLDNPDDNLKRIDTVKANTSGNVSVVEGQLSLNPVKNQNIADNEIEVAFILVEPDFTPPNNITLYDENLQEAGGEWNTAVGLNYAGELEFDSELNVFSGTKTIKVGSPTPGVEAFNLSSSVPAQLSQYGYLHFYFLSNVTAAASFGTPIIEVSISYGNNVETLTLVAGRYGLTASTGVEHLSVVVPLADFNFSGEVIDKIGFSFPGIGFGMVCGIDKVRLVQGVQTAPVYNTLLSLIDTPDSYLGMGGRALKVKQNAQGIEFVEEDDSNIIIIEGSPFQYKPKLGNNGGNVLAGDMALNGWIDANTFGKQLMYVAGDPALFASWQVLEQIKELP